MTPARAAEGVSPVPKKEGEKGKLRFREEERKKKKKNGRKNFFVIFSSLVEFSFPEEGRKKRGKFKENNLDFPRAVLSLRSGAHDRPAAPGKALAMEMFIFH